MTEKTKIICRNCGKIHHIEGRMRYFCDRKCYLEYEKKRLSRARRRGKKYSDLF